MHQGIASAVWASTDQRVGYLGGWHTHAQHWPIPSVIDVADWRRAGAEDQHSLDGLIFVIVGRAQIGVWRMRPGNDEPESIGWEWHQ